MSQTSILSNSSSRSLFTASTGVTVATAMSSAAIVYVAYWTYDSTEVQQGAARYLVAWLLIAAIIALLSDEREISVRYPLSEAPEGRVSRKRYRTAIFSHVESAMDWIAWSLAGWMTVSLVVNSNVANVRLGVNELGWWLAIAALVTVCRRVAVSNRTAVQLTRLIIAVTIGVAVYAWHQLLIGFPQLIADYKANPDAMLRQVGIVAERGSAMRIIFENRLYDGGPTGTFALANSMAVMLVGGLVMMLGTLLTTWRDQRTTQRLLWLGGIAVVGGMLLATRSRSAVLAMLFLVVWLVLSQVNHRHRWIHRLRQWWRSAVAAIALTVLVVVGIGYALRSTEWVQQAPASLAIRFNYWRACFEMVRQSPWVGVGPGQFKSRYEQFRAAGSSEQIADPHQFLLQTVTTGGVPALLMLIALLALLAWNFGRQSRVTIEGIERSSGDDPAIDRREDSLTANVSEAKDVGGVLAGALSAIVGVWLIGAALGELPMFDAALLGTAVAVGFVATAWLRFGASANQAIEFPKFRSIARYAALAIGIDLLASGGMTVPGVSIMAWMLVGIAVPARPASDSRDSRRDGKFVWQRWALVSLVLGSLVGWYLAGIEPLEKSRMLQNRFELSWSRGQVDAAIVSLEEAAQEDPWDAEPWLQLAAVYRSLAITQPLRRVEYEQKWLLAEQESLLRNSLDPVVLRQLGDGRLLFYQRYGNRKMLEAANSLFEKAVNLSPSHETYVAQWAEILRELGDNRAQPTAVRAMELSRSGGYYERSLNFTIILEAKLNQNESAESQLQGPASAILAELLPKLD